MRRQQIIDVIRAELKRQRETSKVSIVESETPDRLTVIGVIDFYEIAVALENAGRK